MNKSYYQKVFIFVLDVVIILITQQIKGIFACAKSANFENPQKDYSLGNHVIDNYNVQSPTECLWKCLANQQCLSINYAHASSGNGFHACELSNQTKFSKPVDYSARSGFTYYGPDTTKKFIGKCIHREDCGSEVDGDGGENAVIVCRCRPDYTGQNCNIHSGVKNCMELQNLGAQDGVYNINPDNHGIMTVYCDQSTDGGGWTVFHRRLSPFSLNFNRGWVDYQNGFGDISGEFWLGNDNIHRLTAEAVKDFRVDLTASGSRNGFAKFKNFQVSNSLHKYRWTMDSFSGNMGNSIYGYSNSAWNQNNQKFSTPDKDNDRNPYGRCASSSGWWYNWCGHSNLNKPSRPHWNSWGHKSTVVRSELKLR